MVTQYPTSTRLITTVHIFDFDGTLYRSPVPNRRNWGQQSHQITNDHLLSGLRWFQEPETLEGKYTWELEDGSSLWITKVVESLRKSINDATVLTVIMTGRNEDYRDHLLDILGSKDEGFILQGIDSLALKPAPVTTTEKHQLPNANLIPTARYKEEYITDLVNTYNPHHVVMWDDRSRHVSRFSKFLLGLEKQRLIKSSKVHHITDKEFHLPIELEKELVGRLDVKRRARAMYLGKEFKELGAVHHTRRGDKDRLAKKEERAERERAKTLRAEKAKKRLSAALDVAALESSTD